MPLRQNTAKIIGILDDKYGPVKPFLNHANAFELLIAVILSAQTTDLLVNKVTPDLFKKYPSAYALSQAPVEEVEDLIKRVNYYKTKAKNIIKTAGLIISKFNNEVPRTIAELTELAGVGRKVANVLVSDFYNIPEGVVVDTHIKRVSYRVGWTDSQNPVKIERDLMQQWPKEAYIHTPKHLILIGRNYCFPRKPDCANCPLNEFCLKRIEQKSSLKK